MWQWCKITIKFAENKGTDEVFIGGQTSYTVAYDALKGRASTDPNGRVTMPPPGATEQKPKAIIPPLLVILQKQRR